MTSSKRQKQGFLIYAHSDKQAVRELYEFLIRNHVNVWLDEKQLLPGQNWRYQIRQKILRSDFVVICLSRQFNTEGGFRHEEVKIALTKAKAIAEEEIFLIPVRLEACDLPTPLGNWHCVDLFEVNGYRKLLRVLKAK
jgi:hypothetical protein